MTNEEFEKFDDDYEVCQCIGVTLAEIKEAIDKGCKDTECISDETDAGTACGLCVSKEDDDANEREIHLDEILDHYKK